MRTPTIRDVARAAGVGVGTVSRVLNNSPQVRPETRQRVLETIDHLGFRPNQIARQLSRGGTGVRSLGIISPFVADDSFVARLQGVQRALNESNYDYDLIFYHVMSPERFSQRLLTIAEQATVEGLLMIIADPTATEREMLEDAGITYVGIADHVQTEWPCVGSDNVAGGELATRYLLDLGHCRIAYVGDNFPLPYGFSTSEKRYEGYCRALTAYGIEVNPDYVQFGRHSREVAYQRTQMLLSLDTPPTAIFSMSDVQALGCLAAIRDAGLSVPGDISIIGFDDVESSRLIGLTTVRQHLEEAGYLALKYLLKLMGDTTPIDMDSMTAVPQLPPFEVVERQTTRRIE
jgi:DNA-binding LacI/PurR family transcriptional regulator